MFNVSIFSKLDMILGEGLYISDQIVYWLDIDNLKLYIKHKDGNEFCYFLPEKASAIWKVDRGIIYLASESGLCSFDSIIKKWEINVSLPKKNQNDFFRTNDGGDIFDGSFLFGTMEKKPTKLAGSLFLTDGLSIKEVYNGIGIPNTFIKLTDEQVLISDSFCKKIFNFKFCQKTRELLKKELWLDLSDFDYVPDGGCIDREKNIYIAMWDGACVNKYDVNANLLNSYFVPAIRPTNCKLSNDEKVMYITTATEGLSKDMLAEYPASGSILKVELD